MFTETEPATDQVTAALLYVEILQFYARHLSLMDSGRTEEWAGTLTEDAEFVLPGAAPVRTRSLIAAGMDRAAAGRAVAGEVHRHHHDTIDVDPQPDGSIRVRCYALVIASRLDGGSRLHRSCICHDVLVREEGRLRVRSRRVTRDDHVGAPG